MGEDVRVQREGERILGAGLKFSWERSFEFAFPPEKVWDVYFARGWHGVPSEGTKFTMPDKAKTKFEVTEVREYKRIAWTEVQDAHSSELVMIFEAIETGTRVTITRAGFGESDDVDVFATSNALGHAEAMHDLGVFLETGVSAPRHLTDKSATGIVYEETQAGLVVRRPTGLGEAVGLRPGDVIVSINGAAVYRRTDMWLLQRLWEPGTPVEVEYVRDGDAHTGSGVMLTIDAAAVGEIGLGPREG